MVIIRDAIKSILKYLSKNNGADADRRWSVHYTTQKPLHGLLFLPSNTRGSDEPGSPEPGPNRALWLHPFASGSAPFSSGSRMHQSERRRSFKWQRSGRKMIRTTTSVWCGRGSTYDPAGADFLLGGAGFLCGGRDFLRAADAGGSDATTAQSVTADIVAIDVTDQTGPRYSQDQGKTDQDSARTRVDQELDQDYSQDQGKTRTGPGLRQDQVRPGLDQDYSRTRVVCELQRLASPSSGYSSQSKPPVLPRVPLLPAPRPLPSPDQVQTQVQVQVQV
ncbi:hypothetical protein WMY93_032639 [Mugilogobius chulae]|uniref:Uncharacterized protein n=1 Tax=Mugilogobius chulae TaxID=88201 RepID=A0AAW0MV33_9GOBI